MFNIFGGVPMPLADVVILDNEETNEVRPDVRRLLRLSQLLKKVSSKITQDIKSELEDVRAYCGEVKAIIGDSHGTTGEG